MRIIGKIIKRNGIIIKWYYYDSFSKNIKDKKVKIKLKCNECFEFNEKNK